MSFGFYRYESNCSGFQNETGLSHINCLGPKFVETYKNQEKKSLLSWSLTPRQKNQSACLRRWRVTEKERRDFAKVALRESHDRHFNLTKNFYFLSLLLFFLLIILLIHGGLCRVSVRDNVIGYPLSNNINALCFTNRDIKGLKLQMRLRPKKDNIKSLLLRGLKLALLFSGTKVRLLKSLRRKTFFVKCQTRGPHPCFMSIIHEDNYMSLSGPIDA